MGGKCPERTTYRFSATERVEQYSERKDVQISIHKHEIPAIVSTMEPHTMMPVFVSVSSV